jgi:predicted RNase H-like HicB family nuclease
VRVTTVLTQYLQAALDRARYEIIKDEEPFYGEVQELPGVCATGMTLEACRANLASPVEDWILFSLAKGLPIPELGDVVLRQPRLVTA